MPPFELPPPYPPPPPHPNTQKHTQTISHKLPPFFEVRDNDQLYSEGKY